MSELTQYSLLLIIALGAVGAVALVRLLAGQLAMKHPKAGTTASPVSSGQVAESGSHMSEPAWRRYHIHYYVFLLLFLAFDMEMAFMYPWAVVFRQLGIEAFVDMGIFLLILFLGLLYAWSQKGLRRP